ncbi:hypothetical protein [Melittangium boletus]|uniref:hypothetical protein n=1 Tax=Melittangium boletus TaxID=83453 RepID=UPI003DA28576
MSEPSLRRAPPSLATTGIGSLPHTELEEGLRAALSLDIPFLPQLPVGRPSELMLPQALEGLPGLSWDGTGRCEVDLEVWSAGRADFEARLEAALDSGDCEAFEPSPEACRAWRPFLGQVARHALPFAKAQLAGSFTARTLVRTREGVPCLDVPGLDAGIHRLVLARCLGMVRALRRTGTTPLFFLDEPGLYAFTRGAPRHALALQEARLLVEALRHEGAWVGVHCCAQTDWAVLLDAGLDVLALDVRLSLDAVLEESGPLARFLAAGGRLSLGLLPTASAYDVDELVDAVEVSLEAALPPGHALADGSLPVLLTPACGLALQAVADAEHLLARLQEARARLERMLTSRARL